MPPYKCRVEIFFRGEISDPQSQTVAANIPNAYPDLEGRVTEFKMGKLMLFTLDSESQDTAEQEAKQLSEKFLANTVIEQFTVAVEPLTSLDSD